MKMQLILAAATVVLTASTASAQKEWYRWHGGACPSTDVNEVRKVDIKADHYDSHRMISPDSAKVIALCAVPGQIGSGEMNPYDGREAYAIDIIPNGKKTHSKVIVDAESGLVLSSKQFGGLRGKVGWMRATFDHKENTKG